jgi:iron complex outermembrane recepter protein
VQLLKFGLTACLSAVSYAVISNHLENLAHAQSSVLPSVTVDAPAQRAARTATPSRQQRAASATRRARASRSNTAAAQPQQAPATQGERADGHVDGYVAKLTGTGSKTSTPIRELPQTINVITADQIRDQGAQSVSQALRYTSGVLSETFGAVSQFDTYTQIRGFQADFFLDGQRLPNGVASTGWASSVIEPFGLERIEVLKGPASALYGQAVPGGLINMISKRPTETPIGEIQLQTGSFERKQAAIDIGGPVDKDKKLLYRFVAVGRNADTQVDFIQNNRAYIAPSFTWRPDLGTSLTVLGSYQAEWGGRTGFNYVPTSGTLLPNPFGRIPFSRYLGEPTFDTFDRQQAAIGYLFEHRFDNVFTVRQNLRYFESDVDLRALNRSGELLADQRTLNRFAFGIDAGAKALTIDNHLEADFRIGPFTHVALFGIDYRKEDNRYNVGRVAAPPIDVWNPVYGLPINNPGTTNFQISNSQEDLVGIYAQDQIKLANWVFTIGGRWDDAKSTSFTKTIFTPSATPLKQDPQAFTGRVGLNYLFDNGLTPYISYATSFRPTPGTSFAGVPFKPTTGEQVEGGLKYQPPGFNTLMTLALFDITQQNRLVADPVNLGSSIQIGEARVRGVEVESRTEITKGLNLIASYAHLDHEVTKRSVPAEIGRKLPQTPSDQGSLWAFYEFQSGPLWGFGFGGGVRYVGETYDLTNARITPGYDLYDAAIKYDFGKMNPQLKGAVLSVNAFNLFDKYYLSQCTFGQGCTLGFRRSVLATLSYRW